MHMHYNMCPRMDNRPIDFGSFCHRAIFRGQRLPSDFDIIHLKTFFHMDESELPMTTYAGPWSALPESVKQQIQISA